MFFCTFLDKIFKFNYILIFALVFPAALVIGPAVAELIMISIIIFCLKKIKLNFNFFIKQNLIKCFFYFYGYLIFLAFIFGENLDIIKTSLFYFRYIFFSLAIYLILDSNKELLRYFFYFFLTIIVIFLIDSLHEFYFSYNLLGFKYESRISSFFNDEWILGSFIVRFYSLAISLYFLSKIKINEFVLFFLIFCISVLIFFTLERSALFLFIMINLILIYYLFIKKKFYIIFFSFLIICILIFSIFISQKNIKNRFFNQTYTEIENIFSKANYSKRKSMIIVALNMGKENIFFGLGPKSFRYKCQETKYQVSYSYMFEKDVRNEINCSTHPHNYLLQLFAETGLIGLSFYLFMFFYFIKELIFTKFNNYINISYSFITLSLIINIFPIVGNGNIFNNFLNMIFFFNLAFFLYLRKLKSINSNI